MAAQAGKLASVAHCAGGFVKLELPGSVGVEKICTVVGRLQVRVLRVAELATERVVDLVVTDQAIRHLGHVGGTHPVGFLHTAMAGFAGISRVQALA